MSSYFRPDTLQSNTVSYVDAFITRFLAKGGVSGALSQLPPSYWTTEGVRTVAFAGGATVTTSAGTSSVTFLFDPITQVSTSDYFTVAMIEYDASFSIIRSRNIRIGGKITDYESAGVIDFRVEVTPASPPDFASGSCAAGKLIVRPADLSTLDVNELARLVTDPTEDIIQGVRPNDGGVRVQLINPSLGSVLSSSSPDALEHLRRVTRRVVGGAGLGSNNGPGSGFLASEAPGQVSTTYFRMFGSNATTVYPIPGGTEALALSFTTPESAYARYEATKQLMFESNDQDGNQYGGGCQTAFYDSAYSTVKQFNSLTSACDISTSFNAAIPGSISSAILTTCAIALDWGGNIVATDVCSVKLSNAGAVGEGPSAESWGSTTVSSSFRLISRSAPINRVVILRMHLALVHVVPTDVNAWIGLDAVAGAPGITLAGAPVTVEITALSESGVPGKPRPMAVFCLAGVNANAVFSIKGDVACATTTNDVFAGVARAPPSDRPLISTSLAESLIETASTELPNVLKVANVSDLAHAATEMSSNGDTRQAVQAMSFKKLGKDLKTVAKVGASLAKNKLVRSAVTMVPGGAAALEVADTAIAVEKAARPHHKR